MDVLMSPAPPALNKNPFLTLLFADSAEHGVQISPYSRKALLRRHDVIHVHFPDSLVRLNTVPSAVISMTLSLGLLWLARMRGAAIVWTGHNLEPHELSRPRVWRVFMRAFVALSDLLVSFGDGATALLAKRYPAVSRLPVAVIPHGHYRDFYTAPPDPEAFRRSAGLDSRPVLLIFGQVRPYKNIPVLIRAWRLLPQPRPQLVIAGYPASAAVEAAVRAEAGDDPDIHLLLHYLDDRQVPSVFAAANAALTLYEPRSTLNSGAVLLAVSMGTPAVVDDTPANRDLRDSLGEEWIRLCDGTAPGSLRAALAAVGARRPAEPDLSSRDFTRLGGQMRSAYREAIALRRGTPGTD